MGLDGERQEWGQIRDLWRHLEEEEPKDWGWGAVPERGAHTKGTVRKGQSQGRAAQVGDRQTVEEPEGWLCSDGNG